MARHELFTGNTRLDEAFENRGRKSLKPAPPFDDADAVRRLQKALVKVLGQNFLKKSFPNGFDKDPDGKYGQETMDAVKAFQRQVFPGQIMEHDGRAGAKTLGKLNERLLAGGGGGGGGNKPPAGKVDVVVVLQGAGAGNNPGLEDPTPQDTVFVPLPKTFKAGLPDSTEYKIFNGDPTPGASVVQRVIDFIKNTRKGDGRVILIGMSSGGATALEVASRLGLPIRFLALSDAAFSSATDGRRHLGFQAAECKNFFQTLSNQFKQEFHGPVSACGGNRDFSGDAEFSSAETARKVKIAALGALPGGFLKINQVNQTFINNIHTMAVGKGNLAAFNRAKDILRSAS